MRRQLGLAAAAVLVAAGGCGDPSAGGGAGLNALRAAAEAATDAGSSRMEMRVATDAGVTRFTMLMEGVFDFDEQRGRATMSFDAPEDVPGVEGETTVIVDGTYAYLTGPTAAAFGGDPEGWSRLDMSRMTGASASQMSQDPSQYLDFLRAAGDDIDEVGTEVVRGVETTHYVTELTIADILEAGRNDQGKEFLRQLEELGSDVEPVPTDVWIAEDGLPRRLEMRLSIQDVPGMGGGEMTMEMSMELFDYGVEVDVDPPAEFEEVVLPAA